MTGDDEPDADVALLTVRLGNARLFVGGARTGGGADRACARDGRGARGCPRSSCADGARRRSSSPPRRREAEMLMWAAAASRARAQPYRAGRHRARQPVRSRLRARPLPGRARLSRRVARPRPPHGRSPERAGSRSASRRMPLYQLGRWDEALAAFEELPVGAAPERARADQPADGDPPDPLHRGDLEQGAGAVRHLRAAGRTRRRAGAIMLRRGRATLALAEGRYDDALATGRRRDRDDGLVGAWPQNVKLGLCCGRRGRARPRPAATGWRSCFGSSRGSPPGCARRSWPPTLIASVGAWR